MGEVTKVSTDSTVMTSAAVTLMSESDDSERGGNTGGRVQSL